MSDAESNPDGVEPESVEKPNPEELEYGVSAPSVERVDGELQPNDHVFEFRDKWQKIGVKPITLGLQRWVENEFEDREEDEVDPKEMLDVLDRVMVEPEIDDWSDQSIVEITGYIKGVIGYIAGDEYANDDFIDEVEEELEARRNEEGN